MSKPLSKRAAAKSQRQKRVRRDRIITIAVVSVLALLFIGAIALSVNNNRSSVGTIVKPEGLVRASITENAVGDPNAPVVVEEFSDFGCSHCRDFWFESEARLLRDYVDQGLVYFKYTPFPLRPGEPYDTANASMCAMEQGKFWEYHDYLFANFDFQQTPDRLYAYAEQLDLDTNQFEQCFEGRKYQQQVEDGLNRGIELGVTGTPTFSINGKLVDRTQVFQTIDSALIGQ